MKENVPATETSWLLAFLFSVRQCNISVAHVSLSGNSAKGKKETKSTAWDQASIPATGQGQMPGFLWLGSAKLLKNKVQNRGQEALARRSHGSFFRNCLIVVVIKIKIDIPCFLQNGSWVLLYSQIHSTLHSTTRIGFSGFWIRPLEHRPEAESVSPLKVKKIKGPWINPPHICSKFWIKTIPQFIWLPEKREKWRKKSPSVSVRKVSHLQYLKLLGNYLEYTLKKCIYLLRFTVSAAYVCQSPTPCPHCAQSTWDVLKAAFISHIQEPERYCGLSPPSFFPKHVWSSFHSLCSCRFPAMLWKLARTWPCCHHIPDYWTVYNALAVLWMRPVYLRQNLGLPLHIHHYCSTSWWSHSWVT